MNRRNIDRLLAAAAAAGWATRERPGLHDIKFERGAELLILDVSRRGAITAGYALIDGDPGHFRSIRGKGKVEQAEQILAAGVGN